MSNTTANQAKRVKSNNIVINTTRLKQMGFLSLDGENTLLNDDYREIKRPLLRNIRGKAAHPIPRANLIQVTSSNQGEGKTFNAINLALSLAMELDHTVLLIDADVIQSSVTQTLGISNEQGLTNYLSGEINNLSSVMLNTNIPKLSILPAGTQHQLSSELLDSELMEGLIDELSERYKDRIVVIDTPPLLLTNEARVLASQVGQIVFIVEKNRTQHQEILQALSFLDQDMAVGIVLNKAYSMEQRKQYGYYAKRI